MTKSISCLMATTLSVVYFTATPLKAHVTVANGGSTSGPILVSTPQTLTKGQSAVSLTYLHVELDSFSDEFLEDVALDGFEEVHNTDDIQITTLGYAYGVTDNLELSLVLPFISRSGIAEGELEEPDEAEVEVLGDNSGIGDITVAAQYQLLNEKSSFADFAVNIGVKLPTGSDNEREDDGSLFEVEFQPGSGSTDVILGASIGKAYGDWSFNYEVEYTVASEGDQDTDIGDTFRLASAISYGWTLDNNANLSLSSEVFYLDQERETIDGEEDENSGGEQLFFAPGIRYTSSQNWGIYGSLAFPIDEDLGGIQNETDYRFNAGISFSY